MVERVQRRATRLIPSQCDLSCESRMKTLKLASLMYRRKRGDMLFMYKLVHGHLGITKEELFLAPSLTSIRRHRFKVDKTRADSRMKRTHFAVKVATYWSSLPHDEVESPSINSCKNRLDKHWATFMHQIPE